MKLTRRGFLKLVATSGAAAFSNELGGRALWAAVQAASSALAADMVAVRDGSPVQLFDAGINALGGMGRFVRKGQTVLVKPNIGWSKTPGEGATTNPELVGRIVEAAYAAGASKVYCFDHSVNRESDCYRLSGIEAAVAKAKGLMRGASAESDYRKVAIPKAKVLKEVEVHKLYLDCDVVINVPILKSHGGGVMTAAMKNLMGVVWDRKFWHREGLMQSIAEFPLARKPDLNVVDAYLVMVQNGPRGVSTEDLVLKKMQLLSPDIVLVDAAAAKILEVSQESVAYLKLAEGLGLGSTSIETRNVKRISLKV